MFYFLVTVLHFFLWKGACARTPKTNLLFPHLINFPRIPANRITNLIVIGIKLKKIYKKK